MNDLTVNMNLGPCCICRQSGPSVRNIIALDRRGPTPGKGWGCLVCGLPMDGATAVLCDACLDRYRAGLVEILDACTGYPADDGRTPVADLPAGEFHHDMRAHPEGTLVGAGVRPLYGDPADWWLINGACDYCGEEDTLYRYHGEIRPGMPLATYCIACAYLHLPGDEESGDEGETVDDWVEAPWP